MNPSLLPVSCSRLVHLYQSLLTRGHCQKSLSSLDTVDLSLSLRDLCLVSWCVLAHLKTGIKRFSPISEFETKYGGYCIELCILLMLSLHLLSKELHFLFEAQLSPIWWTLCKGERVISKDLKKIQINGGVGQQT